MKRNRTILDTDDAFDAALSREISDRCYGQDCALYSGQRIFFGVLHLFPELQGKLPWAHRSIKAWEAIYQEYLRWALDLLTLGGAVIGAKQTMDSYDRLKDRREKALEKLVGMA